MGIALLLVIFAVLVRLSVWADTRFAGYDKLPMQFGPDLSPGWQMHRRWALAFMPALSACILIPTAWAGASIGILAFAGACCVAGHVFHLWLVNRALGGGAA